MRNTEQIWISDGTNIAYLALDAADGLVQRKPEEGPDALVDAPRGVMHMRSIHINLMVTCRDHSSTFHQHQLLQNESIQVRVRSIPMGTATTSNRPHQTGPRRGRGGRRRRSRPHSSG
jgi:hypothetical protein